MGGELAVGFSREVGASTVLANRYFTPLGVTLELRSIAPVKAIISLDIAPRFFVKSMGVYAGPTTTNMRGRGQAWMCEVHVPRGFFKGQ